MTNPAFPYTSHCPDYNSVEDTDTTIEEIEEVFGERVRDIVAQVTDDKKLTKVQRKQAQITKASKKSLEARTVGICDKISNLRSFFDFGAPATWDQTRVQNYFAWSVKVVRGYRPVNAPLEKLFDDLVSRTLTVNGKEITALPEDIDGADLV
jgi:hypothetical protein